MRSNWCAPNPLRKEVLALILNATGPMGAYDLLAKIKSNADRPAAPPTVYRTLDFLLEKASFTDSPRLMPIFRVAIPVKAIKQPFSFALIANQ
jgi:hypothetical protein